MAFRSFLLAHKRVVIAAVLLVVYGAVLAALIDARPLWTDEILQAAGTRDLKASQLFGFLREQPGQAPLGYLPQWIAIHTLGFSIAAARLASALCSLAGCLALLVTCRLLGWRKAALPAIVLWMTLPIQLRYALEGRPYEQGLAMSAVATLLFFRYIHNPDSFRALAYCLAVTLAVYSQPYTLFLQCGLVAVLLFDTGSRRRTFPTASLALIVAALAYLPWYLSAAPVWREKLAPHVWSFELTPRLLLVPFREISGAGYPASLLLIGLAVWGWTQTDSRIRRILTFGITAAFLIPILALPVFRYFYATRQIFYLLIPLLLLAARGVSTIRVSRQVVVLIVFIAAGGPKSFSYFGDQSEDYRLPSAALARAVASGYCVALAPGDQIALYAFYASTLRHAQCGALQSSSKVVVPTSKYINEREFSAIESNLLTAGLRTTETQQVGILTLHFYQRP